MSHIMAYSGTAPIMSVLESTIDDAKKITSDEQYHNFALATKFYELGHYMVVYHIAREILDIRPDYI